MIIGVDMGASAVKLCALEGERSLSHTTSTAGGGDIPAMLARSWAWTRRGRGHRLTGSARNSGLERLGRPRAISEPEAIGEAPAG